MLKKTVVTGVLMLAALAASSLGVKANDEQKYQTTSKPGAAGERGTTLHRGVNVNDPAPDFTLGMYPDGDFTLSDNKGDRTVVLYFYPADNTPVCTRQAEAFRDRLQEFAKYDALIVGVSPDTMASHADFAENYDLPFSLLVDDGDKVRQLYGMPDGYDGWETRATYVIDRNGIVRHVVVDAEDVDKHIDEALNWARKLDMESQRVSANAG